MGTTPVEKTDEQWREELTGEQYEVLRRAATERPFSGKYVHHDENGIYRCAGCGGELFESNAKFESSCGWPSFSEASEEAVMLRPDNSLGMHRIEVLCSRCGGHLGHLFDDGPRPTGQRYCINSVALQFAQSDASEQDPST